MSVILCYNTYQSKHIRMLKKSEKRLDFCVARAAIIVIRFSGADEFNSRNLNFFKLLLVDRSLKLYYRLCHRQVND